MTNEYTKNIYVNICLSFLWYPNAIACSSYTSNLSDNCNDHTEHDVIIYYKFTINLYIIYFTNSVLIIKK